VPLREPGLTPYEIMLSESQERMLLVAKRGRQEEVARIFERWGLEVAEIGEVTDDGLARIVSGKREVAAIPISPLTANAPMYKRPVEVPKNLIARQAAPEVPAPNDPGDALKRLLDTPELGCKSWIWHQYDHTVRTNTVSGPGGDAAVLVLKGTPSGLALVSDVNPGYCSLDPSSGGSQAVAEAVRNLACVGAEPVGLTDCLNFGNPENPEVSWQFRECVQGMSAACRAFDVPVISGNVSFYNETEGQSIPPTPTVAMVGLIPDLMNLPSAHFVAAGDRVILLGLDHEEFGGSAYLRLLYQVEQGRPPKVDLGAEERLADLLRFLAFEGVVHTAHDLSNGGLAITLAEACIQGRLGASLKIDGGPNALFSESQARAIVAVAPEHVPQVLEEAREFGVPAAEAGAVGGTRLEVRFDGGDLRVEVEDLHRIWSTALVRSLGF
ncbi:MAG: phosphoribosylformylglycinamidine synthase II, partial [bacterium]|nr:phosphoribosylformylglycinamidine synthase II [bacterium]